MEFLAQSSDSRTVETLDILGGRFLKRAFPQKTKCVSSHTSEGNSMTGQPKQSLPDVNRRAGTSAAMIGLAISVTAHGFLLHRQGDSAMAAEPTASESATPTANPLAYDVAVLSPNPEALLSAQTNSSASPDASVIQHAVQEGQTLWKIAQFYGVDAVALARVNRIPLNSVLHVGQILTIPLKNRIAPRFPSEALASSVPVTIVGTTPQLSEANDAALKANQDAALVRLKQKRENLQSSLTQLKSLKSQEQAIPFEPAPPTEKTEQAIPFEPAPPTEKTVEQAMIQPEAGSTASLAPSVTISHRVLIGETLGAIARKYNVSLGELARVNRLSDPNVLFAGQMLTIPQMEAGKSDQQLTALPTLIASTDISAPQASSLPSSIPTRPASSLRSEFKPGLAYPWSEPKSEVTSNPISLVNPVGSSSEGTAIATAPFVKDQPAPTGETESKLRYNYVENLRQEIVQLREKYKPSPIQASENSNSAPKVAASSLSTAVSTSSSATSTRINPEFNPTGYAETVRLQVRKLRPQQQNQAEQPSPASKQTTDSAQLVASAPLGSQNYDPLLPSALGKMVSPELPPLGAAASYLPGKTDKFDGYIWPTKGILTSGYGPRWGRMHKGIDIAGPVGTPIVAAAPGVVITSGWNSGGYGYMVEIQHSDGSVTLYAHNNRLLVRKGQTVAQGEQIAEMGSTGYSTGPHSHFEVHLPGKGAVNPIAYLPRSNA
jgi:murein DD-endopeptidase MepM/ murein hydrolase activator NlpD